MGSKESKQISRLAMPKTWKFKRKGIKWIAKPAPGAHKIEDCIPIVLIIRDMLHLAKTAREARSILHNHEVFVDAVRRQEPTFGAGLLDTFAVPKLNLYYRVVFDEKGRLDLAKISKEESHIKPCKIIGKKIIAGKTQLNLYDGKNILVDKDDCKTGDTLVIDLASKKIKEIIKFEKGNHIYLIGGKHKGELGKIEEIKEQTVSYKEGDSLLETSKKYAVVVGSNKPIITIKK